MDFPLWALIFSVLMTLIWPVAILFGIWKLVRFIKGFWSITAETANAPLGFQERVVPIVSYLMLLILMFNIAG